MSQQQIFTRNANAALPPRSQSDNPTLPSGWTYTPQGVDNTHPDEYVSMRSKDSSGVWSDYSSKVPYSHYGEDGTSISIKGVAIEIAQGTLPDALEPYEQDLSLTSLGDAILFDETRDSTFGPAIIKRVQPFIEDEELKHFVVESVTVGDGYLIASKSGQAADEGHLYVAKEFDDSGGDYYFWQDCGRIKGEKGDDAVMYVLEPSIPQFNTDKERTKAQVCTVRAYKIEGKTKSAFTGCFEIMSVVPDGQIQPDSTYQSGNNASFGTNKTNNATSYVVRLWDKDPRELVIDEPEPALLASITIPIAFDGAQGERGKIGRFFYFGGTFDSSDSDPTHTFVVNDAQAPYFEHTETITTQSGTKTIKRYHVFNYETNGSYTMAQMWAISSNWNNEPWEAMTNDFKYIITEALFGSYAHLGSWIFNGDYMLSQTGVDGTENYTQFTGDGSTWQPNLYMNAKTGKLVANSGVIGGFNINNSQIKSGNNNIILNSNGSATIGGFEIATDGKARLKSTLTVGNATAQRIDIIPFVDAYNSQAIEFVRSGTGVNKVVVMELGFSNDNYGYIKITKPATNQDVIDKYMSIDASSMIFRYQNTDYDTLNSIDIKTVSDGAFAQFCYYEPGELEKRFECGIRDKTINLRAYKQNGDSAWSEYSHTLSPDTLSKGSVQVMSLGSLKAIFDGTYYSDRLSKLSVLIIRNNAY